jgi:hypothetical protein
MAQVLWPVITRALILLLALGAAVGRADDDLLSRVEGTYEVPAQCTQMGLNGEQEPCGPQISDRLVIRRLSELSASFDLYSTQINGHQCAVSGIAQLDGDSLVYVDTANPDPGQGIRIHLGPSEITFSYLKDVSSSLRPYCGARAYLSRITFPVSARTQ